MTLLESIAPFVNDVGQTISATDLAALRANTALVDSLSYRRTPAFDSSSASFSNTPGFYSSSNDGQQRWRVWKGGVRWQTGVTTLNVNGRATRSTGGNETLTVYANGVSQGVITPPAGAFSFTAGFTGYTDGQVVTIEIRITGSTWAEDGSYVIYGIYLTPIDYTVTSWPGVPTFAGTYSAALLNQLIAAYTWLYNRMAVVPLVANLALMHQLGPFRLNGNTTAFGAPMYYGSILRGYTEDTLTISAYLVNAKTPGTRYRVLLNGSNVYTGPTRGVGVWSDPIVISLASVAVGARAEVSIFAEVTSENPAGSQESFNYWSFAVIRAQPDFVGGFSYPYASLTATPVGDASISTATLNTFLNSLSTALSAAKTRLDANSVIWGRSYAMRQWYSPRDRTANVGFEQHRSRPRLIRLSDRLIVSGKGVGLGFGAITVPVEEGDPQYGNYVHQFQEEVISGEKEETTIVYLDSIKGLFPGTAYLGTGSINYMAELL